MTTPNATKQEMVRRMQELFAIGRQRYLDAGGDPLRSANEQYLTEDERQEFLELAHQVFDEASMTAYRQKKAQDQDQEVIS